MGRDLFGKDPFADQLIGRASELAQVDLARLCTRGPGRLLERTCNLQPALAVVSLSLWRNLVRAGVQPAVVAGHSLGELPALAASGMVDPVDVVEIAVARGKWMDEAASRYPGGMISVTGLGLDRVAPVVERYSTEGVIGVAAVNGPTQITVSGERGLLDASAREFKGQGGKVTVLRVSGAWHSAHMAGAVEPFRRLLDRFDVGLPSPSMVFNRHGREPKEGEDVRDLIAEQLQHPVRWDRVICTLLDRGVTRFVEIGPGRVLRGLVRLNCQDPRVSVHGVGDRRSLDRAVRELT